MNRREVTAAECAELDDYLRRNRLGPPWPHVASAYQLKHEQRSAGKPHMNSHNVTCLIKPT
jgi:hypothetical protein